MKLVFVSNYLSAHQVPFCDAMYSALKSDFLFVSTIPMEKERIEMGWTQSKREYEMQLNLKDEKTDEIRKIIDEADVVIIGSAPDKLIIKRLKQGKLTIKYAERLYKGKLTALQWIRAYIGTYIHYIRFKKYNFYVLCSSAYTALDLNKFFKFKDRCFKWGYFPEAKTYEDIKKIVEKKEKNSILWCARFIDWKHPEIPVLLAEKLKKEGYSFELSMIGNGKKEEEIHRLIEDKNLNDCVNMIGVIQQNEVREHMEKSEIFLFTSDSNEGWGAVLNEAMNSGCACVSSHAIGSVPYLIEDGENGFLYRNGDLDNLYKKMTLLLDNPDICEELGEKAYSTITKVWNADVAAARFWKLSQAILAGDRNPDLYKTGPCSPAEIIKMTGIDKI